MIFIVYTDYTILLLITTFVSSLSQFFKPITYAKLYQKDPYGRYIYILVDNMWLYPGGFKTHPAMQRQSAKCTEFPLLKTQQMGDLKFLSICQNIFLIDWLMIQSHRYNWSMMILASWWLTKKSRICESIYFHVFMFFYYVLFFCTVFLLSMFYLLSELNGCRFMYYLIYVLLYF